MKIGVKTDVGIYWKDYREMLTLFRDFLLPEMSILGIGFRAHGFQALKIGVRQRIL